MKGYLELRRKLNAARAQLAAQAAVAVLSEPGVGEDLKRLEAFDRILAALPKSSFQNLYPATLVAGVCLLAASIAWAVHVPTTRIHFKIASTSLSLRLAAPIEWEGSWHLGNSGIRLRGFSDLELPPELHPPRPLTQESSLAMTGGGVIITRMHIDKDVYLSLLENQTGDLDLLTRNGPFEGQFDISGSPTVTTGSVDTSTVTLANVTFDTPGTVVFHDQGNRTVVPSQLHAKIAEKLQFPRLLVRSLSLFSETTSEEQESNFVSTISKGTLTLADTGQTIELQAGDPLHIDVVGGLASMVEIGPTGIDVLFDGKVRNLALGAPGFERNLKPTILEYVYHKQKLSFFWGAVTFLWGLIWSARRLFVV